MSKHQKPKKENEGRVRRHHKRQSAPVDPFRGMDAMEMSYYSRWIMVSDKVDDEKALLVKWATRNLAAQESYAAAMHYFVTGVLRSDLPVYEAADFTRRAERLISLRKAQERLAVKCRNAIIIHNNLGRG